MLSYGRWLLVLYMATQQVFADDNYIDIDEFIQQSVREEEAARKQDQPSSKKSKPLATKTVEAGSALKQPAEKTPAQYGIVSLAGAPVYQLPDFDSPIITTLPVDKKIVMSREIFSGPGGLGSFYKVLIGKRAGYLTDIHVVPEIKPDSPVAQTNPEFVDETNRQLGIDAVSETSFWGLSIGNVNFGEKLGGTQYDSNVTVFGLKYSGPDWVDGLPLNFDLIGSGKVPGYYQEANLVADDGFFLVGNLVLVIPLVEWQGGQIYYGLGPTVNYTHFNVSSADQKFSSEEVRAGGILGGGAVLRIYRSWALGLDGRYYFEKTRYFGFTMSLLYGK